MVPLADLKPYEKNAKLHPEDQLAALEAIIRDSGFTAPLVIDPDNSIIAGHGRALVAKRLGMAQVPCVRVTGLSAAQVKALRLSDNQAALRGGWDKDMLLGELTALGAEGFDLGLTAFTPFELGQIKVPGFLPEEQIERAEATPPPPAKPTIKRGELWLLDGHRILCGDSTEKADVERLMGGQRAQMVFTDPPYGVDYTGGMKKRERLADDHVGTDIYGAALSHLNFAADDKAPLYLWYADGHAAAAAAAAAGYAITAQIIWAKNHAQFMTSAHYKGKREPCYYAHRRGKTARWHGPNNEVTLWEYDRSPRNDYHPTQKPVAIAQRAIKNSSKAGQIVLDLFLGGGTTVIAAEMEGRLGFGMELSPAYVEVEILRWQEFTGKVARREDGKTLEELKNGRRRKTA